MTRMPFGKHKGVELEAVPRHYLRWLRKQKQLGGWLAQGIDRVLNGGSSTALPSEDRIDRIVKPWVPTPPEETIGEIVTPCVAEPKELGAFSVRCSGEILDQQGRIIAWTTDSWTAQVILKLLNENEELLLRRGE